MALLLLTLTPTMPRLEHERRNRDTPHRRPPMDMPWTAARRRPPRFLAKSEERVRCRRIGVAQLLSAMKPANRGSRTPLRTAAGSYTFDVSLPPHALSPPVLTPSRVPPLAQFITSRTLAAFSSNRMFADRYRCRIIE